MRELLKTDVRDLTLLCFTASYESDLLIGAGRVKTLRTCYCGLEAFGLAPMFTALATRGDLKLIEETEAAWRLACARRWRAWASCQARAGSARTC